MASVMQEYIDSRAKPPARTEFTEEEIDRALNALLAFGGSPAGAQKALRDAFELEIPTTTLRSWRDATYVERYVALQEEHGQAIEQALIRDTRDLARAASQVERLAIEKAIDGIENGTIRASEAAQIALNMAKLKQSNIDKLLALTGRPQAITEHRSAVELIRALEAKGVIDSGQ